MALVSTVSAQTSFGQPDCGQWIKQLDVAKKSWLLGFLTGFNQVWFGISTSDDLGKINSAQQIFVWMDNYCKANPLNRVGDGAEKLIFELTKKE